MRLLLALPKRGVMLVVNAFLCKQGFQVECVDNGLEAQEALVNGRYDLVIAEEYLPYRSGLELIERAKSNSVPTLIIGDTFSKAKMAEAVDLGAAGFLTKPYRLDELQSAIEDIKNSHHYA